MTVPVELFLQACLDEVTAETYVPIITDWEALVRMRSRTGNDSIPRQLIEERMVAVLPELLPTITDWEELMRMRSGTDYGSKPQRLIMERMAAVLPELLSTTTDWEALVRMRSRTSNGSKPRQLIEERMTTVVQQVTDWEALVMMRSRTDYGSRPQKFIVERMATVYTEAVNSIPSTNSLPPLINALMNEYVSSRAWPDNLDRQLLIDKLKSLQQPAHAA